MRSFVVVPVLYIVTRCSEAECGCPVALAQFLQALGVQSYVFKKKGKKGEKGRGEEERMNETNSKIKSFTAIRRINIHS